MSASKIAITSPLQISKASQTAFAFPLSLCSITVTSKFFFEIELATSSVLSCEAPHAIIISQFSPKYGILSINSSRFPSSFLAGIIMLLDRLVLSDFISFLNTKYVLIPKLNLINKASKKLFIIVPTPINLNGIYCRV